MTPTPEWEILFDDTFGKDGPDANCDSIGRSAGCDDCVCNIEERAEHKAFIRQLREEDMKKLVEKVEGIIKYYPTSYRRQVFSLPVGWTEQLEGKVIDIIKEHYEGRNL